METKLTLEELMAILDAQHKMEYRRMKFAASLKGIDLDAETGDKEITNESLAEAMRRIEIEQGLATDEAGQKNEFSELGLGFVKE